jgi:heptosyltransferase-2
MNLGIFLPNWIGDVVMATPCLRALRKHFGSRARLIGVMRPYVADVLAGTPWLDEHLLYVPASREKELRSWALLRRLRQLRLDAAVLLTNSFRTGLLAYFSSARERVGFARYARTPLLTHKLQPPRQGGKLIRHPMVDYYLELAYAVGCPKENPRLELETTPADERLADLVDSQLGLRQGRVMAFNSSGAFGAAKLWPVEYFAQLARRVATQLDHDVLVLCGPSEREIASAIVQQAKHPRVVSLANHPLSIGLSKACVRRSRLVVSTDSGPRHFAVAFGVPLVSIFGPTPPIWGHNPTAREIQLSVDLDCLGCHQRTCPLGHHRCMRDLSVDRVYAAIIRQLEKQEAGREQAA